MDKHSAVLGIYLNEHLADATGGLELFRRAAGSAWAEVKTGRLFRRSAVSDLMELEGLVLGSRI